MQLNPFLLSIAAPVAAKSVKAVVYAAQDLGQSFLKTLSEFRDEPNARLDDLAPPPLDAQLQNFAERFRNWLANNGIRGPFEMQFEVAENGDEISSVVGRESEQIIDLLYSGSPWLQGLVELASNAQLEADEVPEHSNDRVKIAISSDEARLWREPAHAPRTSR